MCFSRSINIGKALNVAGTSFMTALFGIAQCVGSAVLNTCNRSESIVGYDTLFGDSCGSYAPLKMLTKTEVRELALWLGVPSHLAYKTSIDGLQPLTDEQKFGFSYAELDMFIRHAGEVSQKTADKIVGMYHRNKFKLEIIIKHIYISLDKVSSNLKFIKFICYKSSFKT